MIKKIVSFGCSWTHGDELMDPSIYDLSVCSDLRNDKYRNSHSYPGLIANHFGWDYTCMAYPGCSLQAMIWNFNWWLDKTPKEEQEQTFILVGLTVESRNSWYNPYYQVQGAYPALHRYMHSSWLTSSSDDIKDEPFMEEWRKFNKLYYTLSDCSHAQDINYKEAVRFFDGQSARNNIPMLQVNVLSKQHNITVPTLLDNKFNMDDLIRRNNKDNKLRCPGGHPNEKGHEIISEYLIPHVESAIINEC